MKEKDIGNDKRDDDPKELLYMVFATAIQTRHWSREIEQGRFRRRKGPKKMTQVMMTDSQVNDSFPIPSTVDE